jgi:hypothetical protein
MEIALKIISNEEKVYKIEILFIAQFCRNIHIVLTKTKHLHTITRVWLPGTKYIRIMLRNSVSIKIINLLDPRYKTRK